MADELLKEIRERKAQATAGWADIRKEAEKDMRFVAGDPWDLDDKKQRKDRPTVAPEEMGQYFNQFINLLMANPRGMKFSPNGNGATDKGAEFYQNKARETEYRSNAAIAYITAATNAIQRSYGFVRVTTRYASPRSANQEIWIEAMPDPDLVLIDDEAKAPDSSDMRFAFVHSWIDQEEHRRQHKLKNAHLSDFASRYPSWVQGSKILEAEYWKVTTRKRTLLLVQPPLPAMHGQQRQIAPHPVQPPAPVQLFEDELKQMRGGQVIRELRKVDYPSVKQYFTNGIEILGETSWPGKYIPIVSCYGKVLYVPEGGETKRKILSMTRFGRDPWKSFCYACSQELEIISQVPKANVIVGAGQLAGFEKDWNEAPHIPKAFLPYHMLTDATGSQLLPPPQRLAYVQGENLQALEIVKEGFRRSIQSAMGSNFMPTQAQQQNEKSGKALDKLDQSASQGTYHFVYSYEGMIRQVAVIYEDLVDKIHDYMGDVGVIQADGSAQSVRINDPQDPNAVSTQGDYLVTVSSGPSSDSERDAAADFTDTIVSNLEMVAQIAGPKAAASVLAHSIRMRSELGAMGEQLADLIDPPQPGKDGKPIPPEVQALMTQLQALQQKLQQAEQVIQTKVAEKQAEQQGKLQIAQLQEQSETQRAAMDREVKLAVAEIAAQTKQALQDMALFYEERARLGAQLHEAAMGGADIAHNVALAHHKAASDSLEHAKDRVHERLMADQQHQQTLEQGDQGVAGQLAVQAAAPQPKAPAGV